MLRLIALALAVAAASPVFSGGSHLAVAEETRFLRNVEDVPLMPALQEAEGAGVAFSKPGERIVEAYATGRAGPGEVRRFYEQTLPQLGWVAERLREADRMRFHRSDERLEMTIEQSGELVTVRFSLSPR